MRNHPVASAASDVDFVHYPVSPIFSYPFLSYVPQVSKWLSRSARRCFRFGVAIDMERCLPFCYVTVWPLLEQQS